MYNLKSVFNLKKLHSVSPLRTSFLFLLSSSVHLLIHLYEQRVLFRTRRSLYVYPEGPADTTHIIRNKYDSAGLEAEEKQKQSEDLFSKHVRVGKTQHCPPGDVKQLNTRHART